MRRWSGSSCRHTRARSLGARTALCCSVPTSSLLRRYGAGSSRTAIAAHTDEYALATAVLALDREEDYTGGLIVQASFAPASRRLVMLGQGDMVFHSYSLLHAVDVRSGTRRSLIMWISSNARIFACSREETPWKRRDARRGVAHAQYQLGRQLLFGSSRRGASRAWRWLKRAASGGHSTAQLNWGLEDRDAEGPPPLRAPLVAAGCPPGHRPGAVQPRGDASRRPAPRRPSPRARGCRPRHALAQDGPGRSSLEGR
ncbi:unnamed protein product [Prorocentrum cordatum]|uniref:Fe2OG dioxygenase domain-containing protein n=1 Tax=Prorocentrum cordatum TaxID=2364126 RepID=A0ABN9TGE3_9DINO|nr:unnamed protein product [Polarella glacialis]